MIADLESFEIISKASTEQRWKRMDRAFHRTEELPPVSLYKIGHAYFALDGNHRVSVARFHGVEWIDAEVTQFHVPVRSTEQTTRPEQVTVPDVQPRALTNGEKDS